MPDLFPTKARCKYCDAALNVHGSGGAEAWTTDTCVKCTTTLKEEGHEVPERTVPAPVGDLEKIRKTRQWVLDYVADRHARGIDPMGYPTGQQYLRPKGEVPDRPHDPRACWRGHWWTPENTVDLADGTRRCATCDQENLGKEVQREANRVAGEARPAKARYPRAKIMHSTEQPGWWAVHIYTATSTYVEAPKLYADRSAALAAVPDLLALRPAQEKVMGSGRTSQPPGTCGCCNWPMRASGKLLADHPGTRTRQRAGLCQPCHNRRNKYGKCDH